MANRTSAAARPVANATEVATRRLARRKLGRRVEPYALLFPALAVLLLFFGGPAVYNVLLSFQRVSLFDLGSGGEWAGFANFAELLRDPLTATALKNTTLWLTFATVSVRLVLGLAFAVLLNASVFRRWHLSGLARSLLLIPWVTPPVVAVAAWKWLLDARFGAVNQLLIEVGLIDQGIPFLAQVSTVWISVDVMLVWRELPFVVISLLAGLQAIPEEIAEAARVDGASEARVFGTITLPLLRPVLAVVALLTTIWTFNNFVYVWLATRGGPGDFTQVLATRVFGAAFVDYRIGMGAAIGVLMSAIMFLFAVTYFVVVLRGREP